MTKLNLLPVPAVTDAMVITVKASENPKRGKSAGAFDVYKTGMTVAAFKTAYAAYKAKPGSRTCPALNHIKWDIARGFITLK